MAVTVLTGDIVDSTDLGPARLSTALGALEAAAQDFGTDWSADLRFTAYRGDGWQILVEPAPLAFAATLSLLAALRAEDPDAETRIAIATGDMDSRGTGTLADASGTAFTLSGRALDAMPARRRIATAGLGPEAAAFDLLEIVAAGWTEAQAEALTMALPRAGLTQDQIAERLGISRQAVQLRLSGAGYHALKSARDAMTHG